jgi:hypothetical protein
MDVQVFILGITDLTLEGNGMASCTRFKAFSNFFGCSSTTSSVFGATNNPAFG